MKKETKSIRDYIPLYIGQKIITYWGDTPEIEIIQGIVGDLLVLQYSEDGGIESSTDLSHKFPEGKSPKIILRPLYDITDSENDGWDKISTPIGEMSIESAQQIHWAKRLNYYRSLGLDCDGLIDCGLAVDSKDF